MVLNLSFWNRINSFPLPPSSTLPLSHTTPSHLKCLQPSNFIFILDLCPFQSKNKIFNLNRNFLAEGLFTFFPSIRSWCYLYRAIQFFVLFHKIHLTLSITFWIPLHSYLQHFSFSIAVCPFTPEVTRNTLITKKLQNLKTTSIYLVNLFNSFLTFFLLIFFPKYLTLNLRPLFKQNKNKQKISLE